VAEREVKKPSGDWYDTPRYYDIIFDGGTKQEVCFLQDLHAKYAQGIASSQRNCLEPACGSARLMATLSKAGWQCSGFDTSAAMLRYANKRLRQHCRVALWHDQMQSFSLPATAPQHYALAHCLVSTFKYLLTEADAMAHLQRVAAALLPGGIYALGIHLTDYLLQRPQHERWACERGLTQVVCNTRTWPADRSKRLEQVRNRLCVTEHGKQRRQETLWQFRTYDARQVRALLRRVPELELVACYDFRHDIHCPRELDDSYSDVVLVLRRGCDDE
jgi:hypothetical protein